MKRLFSLLRGNLSRRNSAITNYIRCVAKSQAKSKISPGFYGNFLRSFRRGKILVPEGHIRHGEDPAPQVIQRPGVRGEREGQLVGIQGLPGLAVAAVHIPPAVLAVPQQGTADLRHGHPDLVGPAGEQPTLYQRQRAPGLQSPVQGHGSLSAGNGTAIESHLLFRLIF